MVHPVRLLAVGETAVLAELGSLAQVMAVQALVRRQVHPGIIDVVAAAQTVLITCDSPASVQRIRTLLVNAPPDLPEPPPGIVHTLKTQYDGADLAQVAGLTGLSTEALVSWHSGQQWLAAFGGFAPGFMYLRPTVEPLNIPRRHSPRTVVPTGSVAVGGEFSAVYPGPSPGGWRLLGRCADLLWDACSEVPALLQPGDAVQFVSVRELVTVSGAASSKPSTEAHAPLPVQHGNTTSGLLVLAPGVFTTVQDLGRPGFAHLGVTASGALDRAALRRANRMVGNNNIVPSETTPRTGPGAAGLEMILTGLRVQAAGNQVVAVAGTGIELRAGTDDGTQRILPPNAPFVLRNGETLGIAPRTVIALATGTGPSAHAADFRSYLAVRGGFSIPAVLGSRATDVLSGLGPDMLTAGTFLPVAPASGIVGFPEAAPPSPQKITELRFLLGPRHAWFSPESLAAFESQPWQVSAASNRIGLRLETRGTAGTALERTLEAASAELPSEGMVDGAIQVPPSGLPVLFLADHPVTGGYPVLGVVLREDLSRAAALAPGAHVRFRRVDPD